MGLLILKSVLPSETTFIPTGKGEPEITLVALPSKFSKLANSQGQVFFSVQEFDNAIKNHGINLIHYNIIPCPVGKVFANDQRKPHEDHEGCEGGWIVTKQGMVTALFSSNSLNVDWKDAGIYENSTVTVTLPRFYTDNAEKAVRILPYDRLYLADVALLTEHWSMQEWNSSGIDELRFPVVSVEKLIDSRGVEYYQDKDFNVVKGRIKWIGNTPGIDPSTGIGRVYSVRFLYKPYYIVSANIHELRVVTQRNPVTGENKSVMMPMSVAIHRENVFRDEENDPKSLNPNEKKEHLGPSKIVSSTVNTKNPLGGI